MEVGILDQVTWQKPAKIVEELNDRDVGLASLLTEAVARLVLGQVFNVLVRAAVSLLFLSKIIVARRLIFDLVLVVDCHAAWHQILAAQVLAIVVEILKLDANTQDTSILWSTRVAEDFTNLVSSDHIPLADQVKLLHEAQESGLLVKHILPQNVQQLVIQDAIDIKLLPHLGQPVSGAIGGGRVVLAHASSNQSSKIKWRQIFMTADQRQTLINCLSTFQ